MSDRIPLREHVVRIVRENRRRNVAGIRRDLAKLGLRPTKSVLQSALAAGMQRGLLERVSMGVYTYVQPARVVIDPDLPRPTWPFEEGLFPRQHTPGGGDSQGEEA